MKQNTIIVDGQDFARSLYPLVDVHARMQHLQQHEIENCYDWVVNEALRITMQKRVRNHFTGHIRNDICRVVYDNVASTALQIAEVLVNANGLQLVDNATVKTLITYNCVIIVQTFPG